MKNRTPPQIICNDDDENDNRNLFEIELQIYFSFLYIFFFLQFSFLFLILFSKLLLKKMEKSWFENILIRFICCQC